MLDGAAPLLLDGAAVRRMFPAIAFGVTTTAIVPILLVTPSRAICRMHELLPMSATSAAHRAGSTMRTKRSKRAKKSERREEKQACEERQTSRGGVRAAPRMIRPAATRAEVDAH